MGGCLIGWLVGLMAGRLEAQVERYVDGMKILQNFRPGYFLSGAPVLFVCLIF